jgi:pimeloyl-ACP methyl ester carboxylesterase
MAEAVPPRTVMTVVLADGRRMSWAAPLVMLHGTPGSRLQFQWMHGLGARAGIRVIAPERPGYGASDPMPGGRATDRAAVRGQRRLHGTEDVNVPVGIARWVAAHAPSARLLAQRGSGHLFSLERPQLIFEWVGRS